MHTIVIVHVIILVEHIVVKVGMQLAGSCILTCNTTAELASFHQLAVNYKPE